MADSPFHKFPSTTRQEWIEKIRQDLKGKSIEKYQWTSEEELLLDPVYTKENLPSKEWLGNHRPSKSTTGKANHWRICHDFRVEKPEDARQIIAENAAGLDGIGLVVGLPYREFLFDWKEKALPLNSPRDGIDLRNLTDFQTLLRGFDSRNKEIHLRAGHAILPAFSLLVAAQGNTEIKGTLDGDPLNRLGGDPKNQALLDLLLEDTAAVLHFVQNSEMDYFRSLRVSVEAHQFLGANAIQQIASALSMTVEYVDLFSTRFDFDPHFLFEQIHYHFPVDTDFFTEIAKFRAFHILLRTLQEQYRFTSHRGNRVHGQGATRSLSSLDPHVNMLRATTQAMSAALGGCTDISLPSYNAIETHDDARAVRIAKNVQLILKHESFLDEVADPAGGSYYVEYLTHQFADRAWELFQQTEDKGGYLKAFRSGEMLQKMTAQRDELDRKVAQRKRVLVGVNHYPNHRDKPPTLMTTGYSRDYPLPPRDFFEVRIDQRMQTMVNEPESVGTLAQALEARFHKLEGKLGKSADLLRLSEPFERLRSEVYEYIEDGMPAPVAYLFTFGDLAMRKARANFSANLLGAGGWQIVEREPDDNLELSIHAIGQVRANVIVFCSDDTSYFEKEHQELMARVQARYPDAILLLAGKPKEWTSLRDQGLVRDCLYSGMDAISFLTQLQINTNIKEGSYEA